MLSDAIQLVAGVLRLAKEDLEPWSDIFLLRRYARHRLVVLEGEPAEYLTFILSGTMKLYRTSEDGQEKVVHILRKGDVFGEVSFLDGGTHPVTAETLEESYLVIVHHKDLLRLIREFPAAGERLLRIMATRLRQAYRQITNLALKDAYARTVSRLYKLARDHGVTTEKGIRLGVSLTQSELASMVGTSRETISRVLNDLQKLGIVELQQRTILIREPDKLRNYGNRTV